MACFMRCSRNLQTDGARPRLAARIALAFLPMGQRSLRSLLCWLLALLPLLPLAARATDGVEITQAHLEYSDEGYKLSASYAFELNRGLEEAITRGIPLHFTTEVELTRPRWYWFDEKAITASQTIRISYNVLTRQYRAAIVGSLQQNFSTLDDALSLVRRPRRWAVAERGSLKVGETYNVAVRFMLDVSQLPKPFQVNAINNSDWRFSSDWKRFTYKVEDK
jgi:hypothetical protein